MSPWQRPGRFSQHSGPTCLWSVPPSQPPSDAPCPPCGFTCFLPRLADLPTALLGRKPSGMASRATQRPRLGRRGPTPARSCHWSQGGGWVGWGGAVEDPEHWPREPGVNTDKSLELPSLPLSLSPYFTGKDPRVLPRAHQLRSGIQPCCLPSFLLASSCFHIPGTSPVPFAPLPPLTIPRLPPPSSSPLLVFFFYSVEH